MVKLIQWLKSECWIPTSPCHDINRINLFHYIASNLPTYANRSSTVDTASVKRRKLFPPGSLWKYLRRFPKVKYDNSLKRQYVDFSRQTGADKRQDQETSDEHQIIDCETQNTGGASSSTLSSPPPYASKPLVATEYHDSSLSIEENMPITGCSTTGASTPVSPFDNSMVTSPSDMADTTATTPPQDFNIRTPRPLAKANPRTREVLIRCGENRNLGCLMLLDTGSEAPIMSRNILERCGLQCEPCDEAICICPLQSSSDNTPYSITALGIVKGVEWVFVDERMSRIGTQWLISSPTTTRTDDFYVIDTEQYDLALSSERIDQYEFYRETPHLTPRKVFRPLG